MSENHLLFNTITDDTIRYRLVAERTIAQDDARVGATVTALVSTGGSGQDRLRGAIQDVLRSFIDTPWNFSATERKGEAMGFERVVVRAYARVQSSQLDGLEEKSRRAGREGFAVSDVDVDYTLPAAKVNEVVHGLRLQLVGEAHAHLAEYAERTGRVWRIGAITFGVIDSRDDARLTGKLARLSEGDEDATLSSAASSGKVKLHADVLLRAAASR